jgi:hypothetical protein
VALSLFLVLSLGACIQAAKQVLGLGTGEDNKDVIDAPDPNEYILVKNPQYSPAGGPGVSPPPPEYMWVKRKDVPFTADAFVRGRKVMEASPQEEAKWESQKPPEAQAAPRPDERFFVPPDQLNQPPRKAPPEPPRRSPGRPADPSAFLRPAYGYVVLVKGKQVYTDLSVQSGVAVGSTVIIFREGEELKHPVTGASLGKADEEVARARVLEVGDKTSVAELIDVKEGEEVRAKDKVKLIRAN